MGKTLTSRPPLAGSSFGINSEAVQINDERFRLMVLSIKDYAIVLLNPSGIVTSWNEGVFQIMGYQEEMIIGKSIDLFYPSELVDQAWSQHVLKMALHDGRFEDEGWRLRCDGSRYWANAIITALWTDDHQLLGYSMIIRDLSERRLQEEAFRRSEQRLRLMVEAVKDYAIFLLDPSGHISSWNEGAERIKGYTAEEIMGSHFSIFYPDEMLARGWPEYELEVARREGRFEDEGWRVRKDGSRFWANVVITALWTEERQLMGFTKVTRDLTERKRHEEALQRSEQRLEKAYVELSRKNADLQEFTRAASHDLQEPLRKMRTFAELLQEEYPDMLDDQGRMYINRIHHAARRMSALVNDLLSYSRVDTRIQPFQVVDLNRVAEEVMNDLQVAKDESGGQVELGPLPTIEADRTQMRQLLQNLLGNALKFHAPGQSPFVRVYATPPVLLDGMEGKEIMTLFVEDDGIGFDEKYVNEIFDPFYRLHTLREFEGTGLGLAICRRIVERHQGSITARSRPGQGATFMVTLPTRQHGLPARA